MSPIIPAVDRRALLTAIGAATLVAASPAADGQPPWPHDFVWGVATAAHQIEGGNVNSDYWLLENLPVTDFAEPSLDACDSWHRWGEDVALVRGMGLSAYRFSVEWARIEPEEGRFSLAALDHYRRLCGACREAGIMPIATLHHFSSPRWLAARGGWEVAETAERFARYADRTVRAIGDLIGAACTLNEPNAQVTSFVMRGARPAPREPAMLAEARRRLGADRFNAFFMGDAFRVRDVCLQAHALGREAIGAAVPGLKVGMTLALQDLRAGPGGEALHARIFAEARRPFYEAAARDAFIGVQPYIRLDTGPDEYLAAQPGPWRNRDGRDASPDVVGAVIDEVQRWCPAPIFVSEHGIDTLDDALRARHLAASLDVIAERIAQGVPVLGYLHWSLLDNFEWRSGYAPRFGLVAVDRSTFVRTPKPSAARYAGLVLNARRSGGHRLRARL